MLEAQNRRIDDLLERIRLQQEKLDKQNVRIRTLQSQVGEQFYAGRLRVDPQASHRSNFTLLSSIFELYFLNIFFSFNF